MRFNELYHSKSQEDFRTLRLHCSRFIAESGGLPIIRNLPKDYADIHKVKVRKRKPDIISETFNEAFDKQHYDLRQRAIFANGVVSYEPSSDQSLEPFYVFPVDGFKYMYSSEVQHSSNDYQQVFESVFAQLGDEKGNEVLTDLLRFSYTSTDLSEGIEKGSEIIIYNIPYYYAVRTSAHEEYSDLLTTITTV